MAGFARFAEVVGKMKSKMKKIGKNDEGICIAVAVDYNQPLIFQIEKTLIGVINRTQGPFIQLMSTFKITELSCYCYPLNCISDACKSLKVLKRDILSINLQLQYKPPKNVLNKKEVMQMLANIAMECNSMSITSSSDNAETLKEERLLKGVVYREDESNSHKKELGVAVKGYRKLSL